MSLGRGRENAPVPVPIGPRNDRALARVIAGFVVVIAIGLFGRLVPSPAAKPAGSPAPASLQPTAEARIRLATPYSNVLFFRTSEIAVRGVTEPGIAAVELAVVLDGRVIGEAVIDTEAGHFAGVLSIIPPAIRTAGILEVREADTAGPPLAEVRFSVEAGAGVLPLESSALEAIAGQPFLLDVLVYEDAAEVRALLTNEGKLISQASVQLRSRDDAAPVPRTIGLRLDIPEERLPSRGRLHLIALDAQGREIEHIDSNVRLSNR